MKYSTSYFLVLSLLCASAISNPVSNDKLKSKKNIKGLKKLPNSIKSAVDETKSSNDVEEDSLTWTIERLVPLVKSGFALGAEFADRLFNGDAHDKKVGTFDSNWLARSDRLIAEASGIYKSLIGQGLEIKISDDPKKSKNSGGEILSSSNNKKDSRDVHRRSDLRKSKYATKKASDKQKRDFDFDLLDKVNTLLDKATAAADSDSYSHSVGSALSQAIGGKRLKKFGV